MASVDQPSLDSAITSYYERQFSKLRDDMDAEHKRIEDANERALGQVEDRYRDIIRRKEEDAVEATKAVKTGMNETLAREHETHKRQFADMKENYRSQLYDSKGRVLQAEQDALKKQIRDFDLAAQAARQKEQEDREQLFQAHRANLDAEAIEKSDQIDKLRQAHAEETGDLRQAVKDMTVAGKDLEKQKAEALAQNLKENENDWLLKERRLSNGFEQRIKQLENEVSATESRMRSKSRENLRGKEAYYTKLIQDSNRDNHEERSRIEGEFKNSVEQLNNQRGRENQAIQSAHEQKMMEAHQDRLAALDNQAKSFNESNKRQATDLNEKINVLQKELRKQKTTSDANDISPAAEAKLRQGYLKQQDKLITAESERHKEAMESEHASHAAKIEDLNFEAETTQTRMAQENAREKSQDRVNFNNFIYETEENKKETLHRQDQENAKYVQNMRRQFSQMLERQRRSYENVLENLRNETATKVYGERQEAEFRDRLTQRASNVRQNEVARDYERRLNNLREEGQFQVEEAKNQAYIEKRDMERKAKADIEVLSKGYEQRIAQMEAQAKERERSIAKSYEEQLEQVRRSNALVSRRKT